MNIHQFWPQADLLIDNREHVTENEVRKMLDHRTAVHRGFAELEVRKGVLAPQMDFCSTRGQEGIRILVQRTIEEFMEAYTSEDRAHVLEELVDSINYLWILALIDPNAPRDHMVKAIYDGLNYTNGDWISSANKRLDIYTIGAFTYAFNGLLEKLRNRAWMHNSQDIYFAGWEDIAFALAVGTRHCRVHFNSWEEFAQYYYAKDLVLQFRLKSKY